MTRPLLAAAVVGILFLALAWASFRETGTVRADSPRPEPDAEQALKKARVDGKYRMLLRQFKDPAAAGRYGEFSDVGARSVAEAAGETNIPTGYWVYVRPYWYVWRDKTADNREKRPWGPEQATGEPDTNGTGDLQTAWASATPDGQDEWLVLEYAEPVKPTAVLVYETYNPGALTRVTAFTLDGKEVELWKGDDPTTSDKAGGITEVPVNPGFKTNRVKLYLASKAVPGWNEIDAVGLQAGDRIQWAEAADASSTFAEQRLGLGAAPADNDRLRKLEADVEELKTEIRELKKLLQKGR